MRCTAKRKANRKAAKGVEQQQQVEGDEEDVEYEEDGNFEENGLTAVDSTKEGIPQGLATLEDSTSQVTAVSQHKATPHRLAAPCRVATQTNMKKAAARHKMKKDISEARAKTALFLGQVKKALADATAGE
ncbi:hypothetical protein K470DRAFT_293501 [Piedraia hortae CBS 480.64]|uniref:Uncharacterized protein n=1 Tax=Piedraia hortae CBS 480.64 TaxID=1314780 RepID=A0A6A7C3Z9_9PEZI|nr:hypothetical protein K470DRAFT_293501 [Piedraia hortae CBS 480.64]